MKELLDKLIVKNKALTEYGQVANYIPLLGEADSRDLGISVIDDFGNIYSSGIYDKKFTIQSISKVIALMLAIMDNGEEEVFKKVGMESTDEPFNSFYKLDLPHGDKPANPMINSGAIVTTSLIKGEGEEKLNRLLEILRKITLNSTINYNKEVFLSEKSTGDKNRAIAYLLKNKGLIEGEVEDVLDTYFKQCSIEMDCQDIAKIGIFIANKGRVINTSKKLLDSKTISTLTAIMTTCGMYDFSGEYAIKVGIPSKSGVAGGILALVPNRYGIGVYGPALDKHGNSIAGYGILKDLSNELSLSIFL
ncbi:glutaminase A [Clostridium sp. Cult2]|uniref:glutaminase A n=1 Tax=Clostridium sp. Cult2 TaxID=2079003 RepID=UPI001F002C1A|nr:glutaminase A [Clostridium sp. Cult2]MCF6465765.1 glutaminase A [Clostridium sp. Cult2]